MLSCLRMAYYAVKQGRQTGIFRSWWVRWLLHPKLFITKFPVFLGLIAKNKRKDSVDRSLKSSRAIRKHKHSSRDNQKLRNRRQPLNQKSTSQKQPKMFIRMKQTTRKTLCSWTCPNILTTKKPQLSLQHHPQQQNLRSEKTQGE